MSELLGIHGRSHGSSRRDFLKRSLLGVAALSLPAQLRGDPYAPLIRNSVPREEPVRIRGIVRAGSTPIGGVGVTDGLNVVDTAAERIVERVSLPDLCFSLATLLPKNRSLAGFCYEDELLLALVDPP